MTRAQGLTLTLALLLASLAGFAWLLFSTLS